MLGNKTKRLIDAITSYYGLVMTPSLPYSHTPNLEMLSHLKIMENYILGDGSARDNYHYLFFLDAIASLDWGYESKGGRE